MFQHEQNVECMNTYTIRLDAGLGRIRDWVREDRDWGGFGIGSERIGTGEDLGLGQRGSGVGSVYGGTMVMPYFGSVYTC